MANTELDRRWFEWRDKYGASDEEYEKFLEIEEAIKDMMRQARKDMIIEARSHPGYKWRSY